MWATPEACLSIVRGSRVASDEDGDVVLELCTAQAATLRGQFDVSAQYVSALLTTQVLSNLSSLQEHSHRRYELRRRDLFDQAQLFDDASLSPSTHILPYLAATSALGASAHSIRGEYRAAFHNDDDCAAQSTASAASPAASLRAADGAAQCGPVVPILLPSVGTSSMASSHEYYKHRCEELGVRTQRAVVDALMGSEAPSSWKHHNNASNAGSRLSTPTTAQAAPFVSNNSSISSGTGWSLNLSRVLLGKRGVVPLLDTLQWMGLKRLVERAASQRTAIHAKRAIDCVLPLTGVNVAGCGLSDVAVDCLLLLIAQYFPNVESVDVSNNGGIGYRGGNSILEFVNTTPWSAVRQFHAQDTSIRPATARTIDSVLQRRWSAASSISGEDDSSTPSLINPA